jgi:hypothetical protein
MSNRINDDRSAIVVIMQRLHENDVSGDILAREADYCHMMVRHRKGCGTDLATPEEIKRLVGGA